MKKLLLETSFSKIYMIGMLLITFLILGGYFSYAMFTVSKEKSNAISIVTGNLIYKLEVDGKEDNTLIVEANTTKEFIVTLTNPNNRVARFNFYYLDNLIEGVEAGYILTGDYNASPSETGINLQKSGTSGSSNTYLIRVDNRTGSNITINLGVGVGLDYNDLTLPSNAHLFPEYKEPNIPELDDNMIPVKYNEGNWKKADITNINNDWYNYDEQKWANAVSINKDTVIDVSNSNNHGINHGASIENKEALFDGVDDYVDCGFANYDFKNQITFVVRFNYLSLSSSSDYNNDILGNWENAGGGIGYNSSNKVLLFSIYGTDGYINIDTSIPETDDYYTVVGTYDGSTMRLYINGELIESKEVKTTIKVSPRKILLGANLDGANSVTYYSNAKISDALVFDKGLSEEEIKANYSDEISLGVTQPLFYYNFIDYKDIEVNTLLKEDIIETMWVWIPRYSYSIGSEDGVNYYGKKGEFLSSNPTKELPGEIDVKFIPNSIKEKGSGKYKVSEGINEDSWYTPDAFTFGDKELSGIWVGKFETSSSNPSASNGGGNTLSLDPMIKPNVTSWRNIPVNRAFYSSTYMNAPNNRYGFSSNVDTHMMKKSEWGAISYLSQSKYGKLGNVNFSGENKEIYQNKSDQFITGCSYGSPSNTNTDYGCHYTYEKEITGTGASTTGTIYGIYDMSGGAWEYVMGNYNDVVASGGFISFPALKYYDKYTSDNIKEACNGKECLSHALLETSGWYNDSSAMVNQEHPWFALGGWYQGSTGAGIFNSFYASSSGNINSHSSYRLTLVNEKIDTKIKVVDNSGNFTGYLKYSDGSYVNTNDTVKFVSKLNNSYVIDVYNGNTEDKTNVQLYKSNTSDAQKFNIIYTMIDNYYNIGMDISRTSVIDINGGSTTPGTNIQVFQLLNSKGQLWQFIESNEAGYYYIKSMLGTCVDIYNNEVANGTNIISYTCKNANNQKWKLEKVS